MQNSPEDLEDKLLADWVKGLPDPPPELINSTLNDLRRETSTRPAAVRSRNRWRWSLLAGMTACVGLIIAGLVVGIMSSSDKGQVSGSPTFLGNLVQPPTVTAIENPTPTAAQISAPGVTPLETILPPATAMASPVTPANLSQQTVSPSTASVPATGKVLETPSPSASVPTGRQTASASLPAASARPDLPTVRPVLPTLTRPAETTSPASTPVATVPPTTASPGQATPIVGVITIPASASTAGSPQTFNGQISAINAGSLTLSNLTNSFILNSATRVRVNGQASTAAALQVGDNVIIQAAFNAQGKLVALEISATAKVQPKPISSPVK